uniref:hypothetical protein n=1 Tax=Acidovorax sp. SUPP3334 TaxID=2920881 RepID=UPI002952950F|nr:hypothetical protein [Acidovorax sp. SUPP3334]BDH38346.1 hypothetical protein AVHM3334_23105 [Acidovorax sp. SUPP3334]
MIESRTLTMEMLGHHVAQDQANPFLVFRLSWVAYVRETWALLLRFLLCGILATLISMGLDRYARMHTESWLPVLGLIAAIGWTIYSVMLTHSVRLFTDENGVWKQSGVFPWEKGITGVQWRDLGQAGYHPGFCSWALRSYDVNVTHRFTAGAEISMRHVHRGHLAVQHINAIMAQLQGRVMPSRNHSSS